ncbi:hypothetical protein AURANDRAFT_65640 [Aureococcus anophagefferens]|uniref:Uncharacterized protein n=1 Tax=Aureococcus anophagefferens TaxID=44056 RepID=F0YEM1_AURAN|nr:hypothetical protein AURANDRAFT_65640 [Aureococcus anophagefferens]EGB06449.1 hypothetical protein AURANDRAFT_65640 [Aureococcus anophagefferens]|eukprot:XP_009039020.1 hypothetical protein AURANDRAFT_65640 [Aureococcus anophagefferens]
MSSNAFVPTLPKPALSPADSGDDDLKDVATREEALAAARAADLTPRQLDVIAALDDDSTPEGPSRSLREGMLGSDHSLDSLSIQELATLESPPPASRQTSASTEASPLGGGAFQPVAAGSLHGSSLGLLDLAAEAEARRADDDDKAYGSDEELERTFSQGDLRVRVDSRGATYAAPLRGDASSPAAIFKPVDPAPPSPSAMRALRVEVAAQEAAEAALQGLVGAANAGDDADVDAARSACRDAAAKDAVSAAALRRVVVEAVDRSRGGSSRLLGELRGVLDDLYLVESSRLSDDDDEDDGPDSTAARHRAKVIDHGLEDALRRRDVPALRRLLRDVHGGSGELAEQARRSVAALESASPVPRGAFSLAQARAAADAERTFAAVRDLENALATTEDLGDHYDYDETAGQERQDAERLLTILRGELAAVEALREAMDRRDAAVLAQALDAAYGLIVDFPLRAALSRKSSEDEGAVNTPLGTALRDAQALYDRIQAAAKRPPVVSLGDRLGGFLADAHDALYGAAVDGSLALRDAVLFGVRHPTSSFSLGVLGAAVAVVCVYGLWA